MLIQMLKKTVKYKFGALSYKKPDFNAELFKDSVLIKFHGWSETKGYAFPPSPL